MASSPGDPQGQPPSPGFLQALGSALAAAFGVQSSRNRERDFTHGKPLAFVVAGLVVTAVFILLVWVAVQVALKGAGQ